MKTRMSKPVTGALCAGLISLGLTSMAQANLISRLGGTAVYDTDLGITWLANANANGSMDWTSANAWAAGLTVGGFTDWRLPTMTQPDPTCSFQLNVGSSFPLQGLDLNCTGSEMGHLFNVEGVSAAVPGLFTNVQSNDMYWSATEFAPNPSNSAWGFNFLGGNQNTNVKGHHQYAWAVRSGDVGGASAPEPATLVLLGLGLAGIGFGRRGKRRLC